VADHHPFVDNGKGFCQKCGTGRKMHFSEEPAPEPNFDPRPIESIKMPVSQPEWVRLRQVTCCCNQHGDMRVVGLDYDGQVWEYDRRYDAWKAYSKDTIGPVLDWS
jgi:hypothetical protein